MTSHSPAIVHHSPDGRVPDLPCPRAEGRRIQIRINGVQTVDYVEEDPNIETTGVIAVQIHGGPPSEAWYKDITLLDLSSK